MLFHFPMGKSFYFQFFFSIDICRFQIIHSTGTFTILFTFKPDFLVQIPFGSRRLILTLCNAQKMKKKGKKR